VNLKNDVIVMVNKCAPGMFAAVVGIFPLEGLLI
jgi:hypothetical protein